MKSADPDIVAKIIAKGPAKATSDAVRFCRCGTRLKSTHRNAKFCSPTCARRHWRQAKQRR